MSVVNLREEARKLEEELSGLLGRSVRVPVVEVFVRRCGCRGIVLYVRGLTLDDVEVLGELLSDALSRLGDGCPVAELRRVGPEVRSLMLLEACSEHPPDRNPSLIPLR
ncbi:DUF5402 family protein [Methanopyrus sp.]